MYDLKRVGKVDNTKYWLILNIDSTGKRKQANTVVPHEAADVNPQQNAKLSKTY